MIPDPLRAHRRAARQAFKLFCCGAVAGLAIPWAAPAQTSPAQLLRGFRLLSGPPAGQPGNSPQPPPNAENSAPESESAEGESQEAPPTLIQAILEYPQFTRMPLRILEESVGALEKPENPTPPPPPPSPESPPTVDFSKDISRLSRSVSTGNWPDVGAFLTEKFKEKPEEAVQAWMHIAGCLAKNQDGETAGAAPSSDPQNGAQAAATMAQNLTLQLSSMFNQAPPPQTPALKFPLILPSDITGLADVYPGEINDAAIGALATLVRSCIARNLRLEQLLETLDKGTAKIGGQDPARRLLAAKLLLQSGKGLDAGKFLPSLDEARDQKNAGTLNLLADHLLLKNEAEQKTELLDQAWTATETVLNLAEAPVPERMQALRRAMSLAPRVPSEVARKWLSESFTKEPARGMEMLSGIGSHVISMQLGQPAAAREAALALQLQIVNALIRSNPADHNQWKQPLTVLALNWMQEARHSQLNDRSSQSGPRMNYDNYGNVYFSDTSDGESSGEGDTASLEPILSGRLLLLKPDDEWIQWIEPSLRPALQAQIIELYLNVNEPEAAFPLIEKMSQDLKDEGKRLAERFLEVWTEKHDPNAAQRNTNRYMYVYGYNSQADGIPLTRSRQQRNLEDLAQWVARIRKLPIAPIDESRIAQAFVRTHSTAEVYQLSDLQQVFGPLQELKPASLSRMVQSMRMNLAGLWRNPKVQQDAKTKRNDKEIEAQVKAGYRDALAALDPALKAHPDDWSLRLAHAATSFDQASYENSLEKSSDFTSRRDAALEEFEQAASLYVKSLPSLKPEEQSGDVFNQWFYASLGASDLEALKVEMPEEPRQIEKIRTALAAIPGETGDRHRAQFANLLSTRITAVQPELKNRYLTAGLAIAGAEERARPARELFDYYKDIVTEVRLTTRIDGPDQVGTEPFGVFVEIEHTAMIEREAGGFQKYLQNQKQGNYYNFSRPPENYRDKFEEAARLALKENFEVLSVTFHTDKIESRGGSANGWRVTPYAYFLLKAKGPQIDSLPSLKLNLDFLDTSGFAILPIASSKLPLSAKNPAEARPATHIELKQTLDERKADEGLLVLEIRATAHGLVPPLQDLVSFADSDFALVETTDDGAHVSRLDEESAAATAVSERLWTLQYKARPNLATPPDHFKFPIPKQETIQSSFFRYDDADLAPVESSVRLLQKYDSSGTRRYWLLAAAAGCAALILGLLALLLKRRNPAPAAEDAIAFPTDLNPVSLLGFLRRIQTRDRSPLSAEHSAELEKTIQSLEADYFGASTPAERNLTEIARRWLPHAGGAR